MLIVLPPSETKAPGGRGAPLDLDALSFPTLNDTRATLLDAVEKLAADPAESLRVLGISERQMSEVDRNAAVRTSPTMPAIRRYTGVLYDAVDIGSFTRAERRRAEERLATASALFGLVRAGDPIPAYRLSGGTRLPGMPTMRALWKPALEPALADVGGLVVDMRSGPYAALARIPDAVTVKVSTVDDAGRKSTVSHFNKAYKGKLAAVWAKQRREPSSIDDLLNAATAGGLRLEQTSERDLELLV